MLCNRKRTAWNRVIGRQGRIVGIESEAALHRTIFPDRNNPRVDASAAEEASPLADISLSGGQ